MRLPALLAIASLALPAAARAADITYTVDRTYGQLTVDGAITTDGTIGSLQYDDIVSYNLTVNDPAGSSVINGVTDYYVGVYNPDNTLTATASGIFFNFSDNNEGFFLLNGTENIDYLCYQNNGCYDFSGGGAGAGYTNPYSINETGVQEITNGVAPEPESLGLVSTGLLGIAAAVRRRLTR